MTTNEPKFSRHFAEFLLIEASLDLPEYAEHWRRLDVADENRTRTAYARAYPLKLHNGMQRHWASLYDDQKTLYLEAYAEHLTKQELKLQVERIWLTKATEAVNPVQAAQEARQLLSLLFIIKLSQDAGEPLIRVAVRSHSHDGARTRLYGTEWFKQWAKLNKNHIEDYVGITGMTEEELVADGVLLFATDAEVVKPPKAIFGYKPAPQTVDARPWHVMVYTFGQSDGNNTNCVAVQASDEEAQRLLLEAVQRTMGDHGELYVLARMKSDSDIAFLAIGEGPTCVP